MDWRLWQLQNVTNISSIIVPWLSSVRQSTLLALLNPEKDSIMIPSEIGNYQPLHTA
jgi:hypothetical protein